MAIMTEDTKRKIIIIDDDKFLLDMYAMKFSEQNFEVSQCSSAEEALEKVNSGVTPDIFLVDVIMQKMDGFTFVQTINEKGLKGEAVVIILSNLGQKEDVERGLKLGADGYIVKASATPSEVVNKVLDIMNNKKK
jgi:DNA-binding response OmpR family regulator